MAKRILRLPITLTPKQAEVDRAPQRFKVLKWGRRVGKTWFQAYVLVKWALSKRGKYWYVTKTLALGREELWPVLLNLLPRHYVAKIDERSLSVRLTNGSVICIKSGEKEDNLRGRGLDGIVIDEAAFLKERLWDQILRPQLGHSRGPALIASSPKKGWFTRAFNDAASGKFKDWYASHATVYDSTLGKDEIEVIKAKASDTNWRQEYMAEELANVGQVYEEFSNANIYNPASDFLDSKNFQYVRGIDWGKEAKTGVAWIGVDPSGNFVIPKIHQKAGWDVNRHCPVIHAQSSGLNIFDTVLDRSAFRDVGTGTSIAQLFDREGVRCRESEKDVPASIDIVKRFLRGSGGVPWLYVSSNCPELISAFQDWEHDQHEPDILAAVRYACVHAVRHHLTKLAEAIPTPRPAADPLKGLSEAALLSHARVRIGSSGARWNWDHSAGVPR